ncbi:MAG: FAD-dependent oxidoreductase [Armatimonadetes bacterium]|nr:FAD-dependent oxidoreductase [Armatimonadota bacterium]
MSSTFDYLIVGNSTAAIGAIEAIRKLDSTGTIGVVASETEHTYSRPLITYFLSGKVAEENVYYRPLDFYDRYQVTRLLGHEVTSVDPTNNSVTLDNGEKIGYKSLLLAAGGAPIVPPIPGIDRPGVFFMNTMDDARRARGWLSHASRAVVIGAGLTGLKTAEALREMNLEVTVVELAPRVLATTLDETASEIVLQTLVENGIEVLTGVAVTAIEGSDDSNDVYAVAIDTGEKLVCDAAFITVGVTPRIGIVEASGIAVRKGILVDRHMRTNIANVYAAGDIAEAYDPLTGGQRVIPILPNAYIGGRVAGMNMAGRAAEYNVGMSVNSVSFFHRPVMTAGFATEEGGNGFRVFKRHDPKGYRKLVIRDGKLVGLILTDDVERAGLLTGMMRAGINIDGMEDELLDGKLGLICLPPEIREERIHGRGRNWL